jgi:conserved hypothetical protein, YceG family
MKKLIVIVLVLVLVACAVGAWIFLGSATGFNEPKKYLYIRTTAANQRSVLDSLEKEKLVTNLSAFKWLAGRMHYWNNIKPGRYEITKGASLLSIVRMIHNGHQSPVHLVITKLRTKEDLSKVTGNKFEFDSASMHEFLNNADSLSKYHIDTNKAMVNVFPDSYIFFWNTTPSAIYQKFYSRAKKFWTSDRLQKAKAQGLTPDEVYILASIIEEETNNNGEKGNIASVYMNRMNKGMPLQADPTIKFAMHDFGLRRIYEKYLFTESPYNTYRNKGLPPGPICTPSEKTIDAVLNAPHTDYLYFVANSDFNGTHVFSSNYEEHMKNAKMYQQALNHYDSLKKTE